MGKKIAVVVAFAGIILLAVLLMQEDKEQEKRNAEYTKFQQEMTPLTVQKRHLEQQLKENKNTAKETEKKATVVLLFSGLDKRIYSEVFPIMNRYGYKGVLVVSKQQFPGEDGFMTISHFKALLKEGWTYCLAWDGKEDFFKWQEQMEKRLEKLKLKTGSAIYFTERNYKESYQKTLGECGYNIILHQGDEGKPIIPRGMDGEFLYPGVYGMQGEAPRSQLEKAIELSSNIVYSVGFEAKNELYDKDTFTSMLDWFKSYEKEESVSVSNLNEARKYQIKLEKKAEKEGSEESQKLQDEMKQIDAQIEVLYDKYNIR